MLVPGEKVLHQVNLSLTSAPKKKPSIKNNISDFLDSRGEIYEALKLGLKDYVKKNHFKKVVVGLSGGVDSALVSIISTDVLGSKNVIGIIMPSEFTSKQSLKDARQLAKNLKIEIHEIPIGQLAAVYSKELKPHFKGKKKDGSMDKKIVNAFMQALIVMYNLLETSF